jgi:hypothetical protein
MNFINDSWLLTRSEYQGFVLWDTTNPTAPKMWFLSDPDSPYFGGLGKFKISSSPGPTGVFRTDPSQRVLAITGRVVYQGPKTRHNFTFIIRSSALISLALEVKEGGTIEWKMWREVVALMVERSPRHSASVQVEGSRVFTLIEREPLKCITIYDFSPGACKDPSYHSLFNLPTGWPPDLWPQYSWGVSGDAVFLFDVRRFSSSRTCPVSRLIVGKFGKTGVAPHPNFLVRLNLRWGTGMVFGSLARLDCYKRTSQMHYSCSYFWLR